MSLLGQRGYGLRNTGKDRGAGLVARSACGNSKNLPPRDTRGKRGRLAVELASRNAKRSQSEESGARQKSEPYSTCDTIHV